MALALINLGAAVDDHSGEKMRDGGTKINAMFTEVYADIGTLNTEVAAIPGPAASAGLIGMTAVAGAASTWARSDSIRAIDPAIVPLWTGKHTFNAGAAITGGLTVDALTGSGATSLQSLTATNLSLSGTGSLLQVGSAKVAWDTGSQWAIDIGLGGGLRADINTNVAIDQNIFFTSTGYKFKTANNFGSEFTLNGGNFSWATAPQGAAGAPATLTQVMTLSNAGQLNLTQGLQVATAFDGTANSPTTGAYLSLQESNTTRSLLQHSGRQTELWHWGGSWVKGWTVTDSGAMSVGPMPTSERGQGGFTATNVYAGTVLLTSDLRLKKNLSAIPRALDFIQSLNGVRFDWAENDAPSVGLLAQDVEPTFPELVDGRGETMKSLNYNGIVACLVEAVKEQQTQIDTLKAKIH